MNIYKGYFIIHSLDILVRQGETFLYFPSTYLNNQLSPTSPIRTIPYQEYVTIMRELT